MSSPTFRVQEHHAPYVPPQLPNHDFHRPRENKAILTLNSLVNTPREILATEHQLRLPQLTPLVGVPNKENLNKYCDYHNEKGHNKNDCFHLKKQLEIALESGKLNYLIKDVRQRGKGGQRNNVLHKGKVINMVHYHAVDQKRKTTVTDERWMNVPITFLSVLARDLSEEALVVEAEVEGYLIWMIHIDEGASIEIMYGHCFNMLHPSIRARLVKTQTTVSRFSSEQVKPLGKIQLDVCFRGSGLCQRAIMKFTVILASSLYNIILGRPGLKQLRAIPSTIHGMMKFLTPWGITTLVSQTLAVFECKRVGKKQVVEPTKGTESQERVGLTEEILVNSAYPEQLVLIGKGLSPEGSTQLKNLLKKNKDIFAWEPSDMNGVPKRIIKHSLNDNPSVIPVSQKRRVFSSKKSQVITKEVAEWLKAGIVRPVKYPTWISNPVLVKKVDKSWRMCIDFKNINASCPKDYYPLSEIDRKIESVVGLMCRCVVYREYDLAHLKLVFEFSIYTVWKSVRYGVSNGLDTAYWGFLGVGTTLDIFQNLHILYLQYGILVFSGYGVLVFSGYDVLSLFPSWSLVSAGMDTPYLP
ncbi:hypothetical protein Tco_0680607 [Tanacetum coccineum]|uniref:Reverse transcriptase domain-containing protein n=1 Tax=Tanacetum coccineum TaxID=301880 RepID=A0ABQ4XL22_9ASTR